MPERFDSGIYGPQTSALMIERAQQRVDAS